MKKNIFTIILIFNMILFSQIFSFSDEDNSFKGYTIVIGGDEYFPPFEYLDDKGTYKGFDVDVIRAIAIEMGLDIELQPMTWKKAVTSLQNGQIDAIEGMKHSEERNKYFDFSDPYIISSLSIFIQKDNDYIKALDDLNGKTVAIQDNDVAYGTVSKISEINIIKTDSQLDALEKLINHEVDAYVGNRQTGLYSIQKYEYQSHVKIIGEPINSQNYGIAVKKGDSDLLSTFNEGLSRIKKNGTYDKIYKKWFGEQIYSTKEVLRKYIYVFLFVVFTLGLLSIFMIRLNNILKKEVENRTKEINDEMIFKEQIINSIFSGLITFDRLGNILTANRNVATITKHKTSEFLGKNIRDTFLRDFIDIDKFFRVIDTGINLINYETSANISNEDRIIEYNIYPIKNSFDNIQGITITFIDITIKKKNDEMIKRKDKFESIGRLTANIAHEIRNPLTAIKTYIELIPLKINNREFQKKIVEDVPIVIERLNSLITELLEFTKPKTPRKEEMNLKKSISEIISFLGEEFKKNNVNIIFEIDPSHNIKMDVDHFKQILINLLINALEAIKNKRSPSIVIKSKVVNNGIRLDIIDNGVGIELEDLDMVFEPFYTTKSSGTGLGLAIAQQLAKENDGYINAISEIGKGTIMQIFFICSNSI